MDAIKGWHNIRKFESRELPEEALGHILEVVQWSPSRPNTQCWEVVRDCF